MNVLVCWPPEVPSYFNAGHHLPIFTVASYLRAQGHKVRAVDAGVLNYSWKEFADFIARSEAEAVVLVNDFDVVAGIRRAADYAQALLPGTAVLTVGRLSLQNPGFFRGLAVDGIGESGDYEAAAETFLDWVAAGRPFTALPGVAIRAGSEWTDPAGPGQWLPADHWVLPDVDDIPYEHYERLYSRDANKFCGIPERSELVVPVARGCPVNCAFCDVPTMQGIMERRLGVEETIDYIRGSLAKRSFDYVAFYAPTFTLRKPWVRELCAALQTAQLGLAWKCATTLHHLDEDLVATMGAAGCVRISVGVETFEDSAAQGLPRIKQSARTRFTTVLGWCQRYGIELNCFIIVGLPGSTPEETRATMTEISSAGARVRPTLYTPYERMHPGMTEREMTAFNRQLFVDEEEVRANGHEPIDFLRLLYNYDGYETSAPDLVTAVGESRPRLEHG